VSVIHLPFCPASVLFVLSYMICFLVQINMDGWMAVQLWLMHSLVGKFL